jgi:hypothetical protein
VKPNLVSLKEETSKYQALMCSGSLTVMSEVLRGFHKFLLECTEKVT